MSDVMERAETKQPTGEIPKTMQAVVCYAPGDYRLEEVEVPTPGPGEILCRVELVGICMSDVKVFHGAPSFWGDETQPRYVKPPMIPGHEFVCHVVALGEGAGEAKNVKIGDRVISEQIVPCWDCRFCNRGPINFTSVFEQVGFNATFNNSLAIFFSF